MAIYAAAKAAERVTEYVPAFERQARAMHGHAKWLAEYDATP